MYLGLANKNPKYSLIVKEHNSAKCYFKRPVNKKLSAIAFLRTKKSCKKELLTINNPITYNVLELFKKKEPDGLFLSVKG